MHPYEYYKQSKRYQPKRELAMWENFLLFLIENKIQTFKTASVYAWYTKNKKGFGHADHSAIYPNILNPMRSRNLITSTETGVWTLEITDSDPRLKELQSRSKFISLDLDRNPKNEPNEPDGLSKEDEKFFKYIQSKITDTDRNP